MKHQKLNILEFVVHMAPFTATQPGSAERKQPKVIHK